MAITHQIADDTLISVDPGDARGPWTIEFPANPFEGDSFTVRAVNRDETLVTFDGNGRDLELTEQDTLSATVSLNMNGRSMSFIYAIERDSWVIVGDLSPRTRLEPQPIISA